jgi:hypothetical protein
MTTVLDAEWPNGDAISKTGRSTHTWRTVSGASYHELSALA